MALQPFEVVKGGATRTSGRRRWRYIQYQYTTRLIGDGFFGKDVDIPACKITYHIQSAIGGGSQGRDQTYALPALAMRVISLVPKKAADIRDTTADTFADIEARRLRSSAEFVGVGDRVRLRASCSSAWRSCASSAGTASARRRPSAPLPLGAVLRGCRARSRRSVKDVARDGWTPRARRAARWRCSASPAPSRSAVPSPRTIVDAHVDAGDGQLARAQGPAAGRKRVAGLDVDDVRHDRATLADTNGHAASPRTELLLNDLQESLSTFSAAALRPERPARHGGARRRARAAATDALKKLRVANVWPVRTAGALARTAADVGSMVWSR